MSATQVRPPIARLPKDLRRALGIRALTRQEAWKLYHLELQKLPPPPELMPAVERLLLVYASSPSPHLH